MRKHTGPSGRSIAWRAGLVGIALTATSVISLEGTAGASGLLPIIPTTTTLSVSTNPIHDGSTETMTATVGPFDLALTPTGTVTFELLSGPLVTGVVTVSLTGGCLILVSTCSASYSFPVLQTLIPPGTYVVKALYSGDVISKPSSSQLTLTVVAPS
jgi:hypothetical protein